MFALALNLQHLCDTTRFRGAVEAYHSPSPQYLGRDSRRDTLVIIWGLPGFFWYVREKVLFPCIYHILANTYNWFYRTSVEIGTVQREGTEFDIP